MGKEIYNLFYHCYIAHFNIYLYIYDSYIFQISVHNSSQTCSKVLNVNVTLCAKVQIWIELHPGRLAHIRDGNIMATPPTFLSLFQTPSIFVFHSPLFMRPPFSVYTSISFVNTSVFLYALVNLLWYICNLYRLFSQFGWIQPHFEPSMFTILQRLPILFSLYIPRLPNHPVISSTICLEQSS